MTQEEKQLLLKDLCARLCYGVKTTNGNGILELSPRTDVIYIVDNRYIPYLRPISSMTKEEIVELQKLSSGLVWTKDILRDEILRVRYLPDAIDWLNSHHFDYRNLIEKGLALEAPKGMYNTKTEWL